MPLKLTTLVSDGSPFYTYAHFKPDGSVFYIGKGKKRRAYSSDRRNTHWASIVKKYGKPRVEIIAGWDTEKEALEHEKVLIASFRYMGFPLANKTDGGEGFSGFSKPAWNKGLKGVSKAWNKGIHLSEEHRLKVSVAKKGKPSNAKGYKHTTETRLKISLSKKGKSFMSDDVKMTVSDTITKMNKQMLSCEYCGKNGNIGSLSRWHMNNCKFKENQ